MEAKRKYIIIGSSAVLVGVAAYLTVDHFVKKKEIKFIMDYVIGAKNSAGEPTVKPNVSSLPEGSFPLKLGDKNKKVALLQRALNVKYDLTLSEDGLFGQSTASALCKNYFTTCFTDIQSRMYEVTNSDYDNIRK